MQSPVDARAVANWFVKRANSESKRFSIMELLKLVYISHGWHLEIFDAPLFTNRIEAWKFGPVIPEVYNSFRSQGVVVNEPLEAFDAGVLISERQESLLEEIFGIYGGMPAFKLSDITHEVGGPWDQATKTLGYFAPIGNDVIRNHYKQKRAKANST